MIEFKNRPTAGPWKLAKPGIFGNEHPVIMRGKEGGFQVTGLSKEQELIDARAISEVPRMCDLLWEIYLAWREESLNSIHSLKFHEIRDMIERINGERL